MEKKNKNATPSGPGNDRAHLRDRASCIVITTSRPSSPAIGPDNRRGVCGAGWFGGAVFADQLSCLSFGFALLCFRRGCLCFFAGGLNGLQYIQYVAAPHMYEWHASHRIASYPIPGVRCDVMRCDAMLPSWLVLLDSWTGGTFVFQPHRLPTGWAWKHKRKQYRAVPTFARF
jgi:hypothetical protein